MPPPTDPSPKMLTNITRPSGLKQAPAGSLSLSDKVAMCNYWANRMCCEAADRAMQVHGGIGYLRHKPFEQI